MYVHVSQTSLACPVDVSFTWPGVWAHRAPAAARDLLGSCPSAFAFTASLVSFLLNSHSCLSLSKKAGHYRFIIASASFHSVSECFLQQYVFRFLRLGVFSLLLKLFLESVLTDASVQMASWDDWMWSPSSVIRVDVAASQSKSSLGTWRAFSEVPLWEYSEKEPAILLHSCAGIIMKGTKCDCSYCCCCWQMVQLGMSRGITKLFWMLSWINGLCRYHIKIWAKKLSSCTRNFKKSSKSGREGSIKRV